MIQDTTIEQEWEESTEEDDENIRILPDKMPDDIRCMTTHLPYAWEIILGIKEAEARGKKTDYRGWVFIQAGLSQDSDDEFDDPESELKEYGIDRNSQRGVIIGVAYLYDCQLWTSQDGRFSVWEYYFDACVELPTPVPIKGKQPPLWKANGAEEKAKFELAWQQALLALEEE